MSQDWAELTLQYLAFREPDLLKQAIASAASDPEILALLTAFQQYDIPDGDCRTASLVHQLQTARRNIEAAIVMLLFYDLRVQQIYHYNMFRIEEQLQSLQTGMQSCEEAIRLTTKLAAWPAVAHYQGMLASAFVRQQQWIEARDANVKAVSIYCNLASVQPGVYDSYVAMTLTNLGNVLSELKEFEAAREAYEDALDLYNLLTSVQPDVYRPDLASTLNNQGNLLRELKEFEAARKAIEEALRIRRDLASVQPDVYDSDVAMTLTNLGNVLSELKEFEAARKAHEGALGLYHRLALVQPKVYEPSMAGILNNLGLVLGELNEFEAARQAYGEALGRYNLLASVHPKVYEPSMAATLTNLGNVLGKLKEFKAARKAIEEARMIFQDLASVQPYAYEPDLAKTLINYGNVLSYLQEMEAGRQAYTEGLSLFRRLASVQPDVYDSDVATTLTNLGSVLRELKEFEAARKAIEEALRIRRDLASVQPDVYDSDVAMTLTNLGNVLSELKEFEAAREAYEDALGRYNLLASVQPGVYEPIMATTLNNLGTALYEREEFEAARKAIEEALRIRRDLASVQPDVYDSDVAATLNSEGRLLRELKRFEDAQKAHEEALGLYRRLASVQPDVYDSNVATTLNDQGNLLYVLKDFDAAKWAFAEAIALEEKHSLWLDSAVTYANLGTLEEDTPTPSRERIRKCFETCVRCCEQGIGQLAESEHRDLFKGKFEMATLWLIEDQAYQASNANAAAAERLIGYLEALRRVETIARIEETTQTEDTPWQIAYHELRNNTGSLSIQLHQLQAALLWIHVTQNAVVFVTLKPGECRVDLAERMLYDQLLALFEDVEAEFERRQQLVQAMKQTESALNAPHQTAVGLQALLKIKNHQQQQIHVWLETASPALTQAGERAFGLLPEAIQTLLADEAYSTVFLAPCSATIFLPFELLRLPSKSSPESEHDDAFLGLRKQLVRVHGLAELAQVIERQPSAQSGRTALVVGDPTQDLPGAEAMATHLANRLETETLILPFEVSLALGNNATAATLETVLREDAPALWAYNGHGNRALSEEGATYLSLANDTRFYPRQLARLQLPATFVHNDCCMTGLAWGKGGGRFDGFPTAALMAGASCVLSSVHPLLDRHAAELSDALYTLMLNPDNPLPVGEALLEARRAIAAQYANPLLWATTILWGNPQARLLPERRG